MFLVFNSEQLWFFSPLSQGTLHTGNSAADADADADAGADADADANVDANADDAVNADADIDGDILTFSSSTRSYTLQIVFADFSDFAVFL